MAINFKSSSPLVSAANTIVPIRTSRPNEIRSAQNNIRNFIRFLDIQRSEIEKLKLPETNKIKRLSNIDLSNSFGNVGNLLRNLASGALDIAGFLGNMFPIRGKAGSPKQPPISGEIAKPKVKPAGGGFRFGGLRAVGIANALFAGLDFATGLSEGEGVGKAAAGAGGSLAGSLLGGAIGQTLIPIPGVGFVLGSIAGGFLGGYAGDRTYEMATGGAGTVSQKLQQRLKEQEELQRKGALTSGGLMESLNRFDEVVSRFESFANNIGNIIRSPRNYEGTSEGGGNITPLPSDTQPYDGPVDAESFDPLPNGILSTAKVGVKGGEYGAPRRYPGGHSGQDIGGLAPGSPVVAWKTGKLSYIGSVEPGDTILEIDHGGGMKSRYKHVVPTVPSGSVVYGGQQIAKLFNTKAYDPHLHFEVWKNGSHTNPINYIKAAQRISRPLSIEKAKENSGRTSGTTIKPSQEVGIDIYPSGTQTPQQIPTQQKIPQVTSQQTQTQKMSSVLSAPIIQPDLTQQKIQPEQYEYYPSYSQNQALIVDRPMIISSGNNSASPMVIPMGGNSGSKIIMVSPPEGQLVNSFIKTILLTNLSSS